MLGPGIRQWLGTAHSEVIGERDECNINACRTEIDKITPDRTLRDSIVAQLAGAHMMGNNLLHEAAIVRAGAQASHNLLCQRDSGLRMVIEANSPFFVYGVSSSLANIV